MLEQSDRQTTAASCVLCVRTRPAREAALRPVSSHGSGWFCYGGGRRVRYKLRGIHNHGHLVAELITGAGALLSVTQLAAAAAVERCCAVLCVLCVLTCACRTLVTHLTASCVVRAHAMQCDGTSPVRSRATGVEPPGLSDPYIVLDEAARVGPRSNKRGGRVRRSDRRRIDGASTARDARHSSMWSGGLCGPEGRSCEPRLRRAPEQAHPAPLQQWQGHGRRWRAVRVHVA